MPNLRKTERGYIALITAIIVSSVIAVIGMSLTLTSIDHGQIAMTNNDSLEANQIARSCLDDVLVRHYLEKPISDTIVLPIGTCSVSFTTDAGTTVYTVVYDSDGYSKVLEATVLDDGTGRIYIKEK